MHFLSWFTSGTCDVFQIKWMCAGTVQAKSSAFMYITFRMSSSRTKRRVCHLSAGPRRWSHHTSEHQGCNTWSVPSSHISTSRRICHQIQHSAKRERGGNLGAAVSVWNITPLCPTKAKHSISSNYHHHCTHRRSREWLHKATSRAGTLVDQDSFFPFLFVLLYFIIFKLIAISHSLHVKCKHAPWIWILNWKAQW